MSISVGKRPNKFKMVPKGKKERKSSREVIASSSKVSKANCISKESPKVVIVESDEENSEKASLKRSATTRKMMISSPISSEEGSFDEYKVLEMLGRPDGLKIVGELYIIVPSYDQYIIEHACVMYLLWNNLVPKNVVDIVLEVLIELLIEQMATITCDDSESSEPCTKGNMIKKITEMFLKAHHDLKLYLVNFSKIMDNASQLYRYCLRWLVAIK